MAIPRPVWRVFCLIVLAVAAWVALRPVGGEQWFVGQDKVLHFCAYIVFYILTWLGWPGSAFRWQLYLGLLAYGVGIEFLQGRTGYRTAEAWDVLANFSGMVAGHGLLKIGLRRVTLHS